MMSFDEVGAIAIYRPYEVAQHQLIVGMNLTGKSAGLTCELKGFVFD